MTSIDSSKIADVEVKNENDISTSEVMQTNNDRNLNISTVAKVDEETVVSSEISTSNKALYSFCKEKSIVNALTVGEVGTLEIQTEIKNNAYGITLLPNRAELDYEKLVIDLPRMCSQMAKCSTHSFRPNVGDLICGRRADGDWLRGYVVSNQPSIRMAMIEEAKIVPINKIATCDKLFSDINAFGAICEVTNAKHKFEEGDMCEFEVTGQTHNKEQGGFEILILKKEMNVYLKIEATVKPWIPMPEQIGLQYAELKNESEVCLTSYRSHIHLFVRPLDTAGLEHYNHVMQNVAKCAQTSSFLKELPVVGQMVIAQFADENYYRAVVIKIQDDKITVSYVDFGNTEVTNIKKLKILSDNLKELRSCTTKVVLKDVPKNVRVTKEVNDYLAQIVGTKVPLLCTFEGMPSKDGVYLKFRDGKSINKMISKLLEPISKKAAE
ncbi:uncharacterized protein LOC117157357 isoform X1 [Bombus vancouverensis nearcticus]|uniref:uncharacterized protein LOC117157357 isoform X1 n=1 Tax=Bombus vancouverensis nearcticus TaxID=2705178 RepID=UPI00143B675D|nr:uncharacterized protein LOC117157357 isoform X1 [Bombus vancouverensis nearcticus]